MKQFFAVGLGIFLLVSHSRGALYLGNGDTSFSGAVGLGSLSLTDNGTVISGTFTRGTGSFLDSLVIFIDSKSGGFSTTSGFTDASTRQARNISGLDGTGNRATATFATGFSADYAIVLANHNSNHGGELYQVVNNGTHIDIGSVNLSPIDSGTASSYTFSLNWSDIGLTGAPGVSFKFESTYIGDTGFRSLESFETLTGDPGWGDVTFGNFHTYVAPVPETTNVALAVFGAAALGMGLLRRARRFRSKGG